VPRSLDNKYPFLYRLRQRAGVFSPNKGLFFPTYPTFHTVPLVGHWFWPVVPFHPYWSKMTTMSKRLIVLNIVSCITSSGKSFMHMVDDHSAINKNTQCNTFADDRYLDEWASFYNTERLTVNLVSDVFEECPAHWTINIHFYIDFDKEQAYLVTIKDSFSLPTQPSILFHFIKWRSFIEISIVCERVALCISGNRRQYPDM
jgi:hypothetical protein